MLLTLQLGSAQRSLRARPELRLWTWGCWALLLGFAALGARVWLPTGLSVVLGNALICAGLALFSLAIHRFLPAGRPPLWLLWAQPPLWLALLWMLAWPLHQRTAVLSLVYLALLAPSVAVIVRRGWSGERSLRVVALTMVLTMLALLVRAWHAWTLPQDYQDMLQGSLAQGLTFLMAFGGMLGAGFGFVLAVFERVAQQMEQQATHDGLTGCLNRSTVDTLLEHALQRARREGTPLAFVLLDLDHFKQVNDQHGHRMGDEVLRRFAQTVRGRLRASDAFGRTGGEEFGLVLPATDEAGARRLLEVVRQAVMAMAVADAQGQPVPVTVSAGIAVAAPQDEVSGDRLYGRADQALYEAKRAGRNRVELYGNSNPAQASLLPGG